MLTDQHLASIRQMALAYTRLPPKQEVWQWAEANLQILNAPTPRPGPFRTTLTPYVREPLEAWRDPDVRECVLCFGSQTGKTTMLIVGQCWQMHNAPGPSLWVFPNEDNARTFSATRFIRMLEDSTPLRDMLPRDRRKLKALDVQLGRSLTLFRGSNSPANLASNPVRTVVMDEVDKLAEASAKEADAVDLAEQRTKAFHQSRKVFLTSTPTISEATIWTRYLTGDQRRYFCRCIHCDGEILPVLSKTMTNMPATGCEAELVWDESAQTPDGWDYAAVARSVRLICPHCGGAMLDHHKTRLLRTAVWKPTATATHAWLRSYHLSSLYSTDIPWPELVVKFLAKKASIDGLQGFVNGMLSEPWQHQDERSARTEMVVSGELVEGEVICRILTADVQHTPPNWYVVREWYAGGHSRLVEWGKWQTYEDLDEIRQRLSVKPDVCGVDSGWQRAEVQRQCAQLGYFTLRGDDAESWPEEGKARSKTRLPWRVRKYDPYVGTNDAGRQRVSELMWSNPSIKDALSVLRDSSKSPVRWEVPEEYATDEYWRHLDGEYKERKYMPATGKTIYRWRTRGRRWPNHLFDCECMQLAIAICLKILDTGGDDA